MTLATDPVHRSLQVGLSTLDIEISALQDLRARVATQSAPFAQAVSLLINTQGRVVVMGMGKSGHIGRKIAATLSSTGTPAMFVHPAEASHGDLGMLKELDTVLAISNSGESDELSMLLPFIKRMGIQLIAITGSVVSSLARHADVVLNSGVQQEACPLNLAPTASTTSQLALGDALATAVLDARGFKAEDFARSHPGGSLGRKLLIHVRDLMRVGDALPKVTLQVSLMELMHEMSKKGLGAAAVLNDQERLVGIFTDGDLRRLIEKGGDIKTYRAQDVMQTQACTISENALAVQAAELMEKRQINCILVIDAQEQLIGALSTNDLMRAKVI